MPKNDNKKCKKFDILEINLNVLQLISNYFHTL